MCPPFFAGAVRDSLLVFGAPVGSVVSVKFAFEESLTVSPRLFDTFVFG